MSEHTPGPWQVDPDEQHDIGGSRIFKVCSAKPYSGLIADVSAWWVDTASAEANAYLIASAPILLEALEHVAILLNFGDPQDVPSYIRTAIAQAKGE